MADGENMGDLVYNAVYNSGLRIGLGRQLSHDLARDSENELRRRSGGQRVYVPAPSRSERDAMIAQGLADGGSVREVAKAVGVSSHTVWRFKRDYVDL